MNPDDVPDEIRALLQAHGLESVAVHHAVELADRIRWASRPRKGADRKLTSRDLKECATAANRLARHQQRPPRDPAATQRARERLLESLDTIGSVVALAAQPDGPNVTSMVELLRAGETPDVSTLGALVSAMGSVPLGTGAAPPSARNDLIRSAVIVWRSVHGAGGYWYDSEFSENEVRGPLPRFIEATLETAGLAVPSGDALHSQLRKLTDIE